MVNITISIRSNSRPVVDITKCISNKTRSKINSRVWFQVMRKYRHNVCWMCKETIEILIREQVWQARHD